MNSSIYSKNGYINISDRHNRRSKGAYFERIVYDFLYDLDNKELIHNQFNDKIADIIYKDNYIECKNWENTTNLTGLLIATQITPKFNDSKNKHRIALFKNKMNLTRKAKDLLAKHNIAYMAWDTFKAWIRAKIKPKTASLRQVIYRSYNDRYSRCNSNDGQPAYGMANCDRTIPINGCSNERDIIYINYLSNPIDSPPKNPELAEYESNLGILSRLKLWKSYWPLKKEYERYLEVLGGYYNRFEGHKDITITKEQYGYKVNDKVYFYSFYEALEYIYRVYGTDISIHRLD